jgi:hypothetical protein
MSDLHTGQQRNLISRTYFVTTDDSHDGVNNRTTKKGSQTSKISGKIIVGTLTG